MIFSRKLATFALVSQVGAVLFLNAGFSATSFDSLTIRIARSQRETAWTKVLTAKVRYFQKTTDPKGHSWCQSYFETKTLFPVSVSPEEAVFQVPAAMDASWSCSLPLKIVDVSFQGDQRTDEETLIQLLGADQMWQDTIGKYQNPPFAQSVESLNFIPASGGVEVVLGRYLIGFEPLQRYPEGLQFRLN